LLRLTDVVERIRGQREQHSRRLRLHQHCDRNRMRRDILRNSLRLAIIEQAKVIGRKPADETAIAIGDRDRSQHECRRRTDDRVVASASIRLGRLRLRRLLRKAWGDEEAHNA